MKRTKTGRCTGARARARRVAWFGALLVVACGGGKPADAPSARGAARPVPDTAYDPTDWARHAAPAPGVVLDAASLAWLPYQGRGQWVASYRWILHPPAQAVPSMLDEETFRTLRTRIADRGLYGVHLKGRGVGARFELYLNGWSTWVVGDHGFASLRETMEGPTWDAEVGDAAVPTLGDWSSFGPLAEGKDLPRPVTWHGAPDAGRRDPRQWLFDGARWVFHPPAEAVWALFGAAIVDACREGFAAVPDRVWCTHAGPLVQLAIRRDGLARLALSPDAFRETWRGAHVVDIPDTRPKPSAR